MGRAEEPIKNYSWRHVRREAQVRALVNRQLLAWKKRDFAIAADDWLPNGELFSPGGHVFKKDMQSAILDYFKNFTDLKVTINEMFLFEDGTRLAIQWRENRHLERILRLTGLDAFSSNFGIPHTSGSRRYGRGYLLFFFAYDRFKA
jgi:hypothetical protein